MSYAAHIAASGPAEGACLAREHAGEAPRAPKLIDVVRDTLRARHYSRRTEKAYIGWIRRYILFHGKRHPRELGAAEATRFLTALAVDAKVSASTQNQALAALLFLYREVVRIELPWLDDLVRARRPRRLPVVVSRDEVCAVIAQLAGTPKLMACLLYGAGLRLLECARLRVKDIDFEASHIVVRAGKGDKDRITVLPPDRQGAAAAPPRARATSPRARCRQRRRLGRAAGQPRPEVPERGSGVGVAVGVPRHPAVQ